MDQMVTRGVWKVPYKVDGRPAAMAVDSHNRRVAVVVLHPGVDGRAVKRLLTAVLDLVDPQPRIQLVQDDASSIRAWAASASLSDDALLSLLGGYGLESGTG